MKLIQFVDCFPDGHGSYDSNLMSFRIKFVQTILNKETDSTDYQRNKTGKILTFFFISAIFMLLTENQIY